MDNKVKTTIYLLTASFILILAQFFVPPVQNIMQGPIFLLPIFIYALLGLLLTIFTWRSKIKGKLKKYLILTGASAFGFFIFMILHNLFFAFAELTKDIIVIKVIMEILHGGFFLISLIVCPIGFIVGMTGSIILTYKK